MSELKVQALSSLIIFILKFCLGSKRVLSKNPTLDQQILNREGENSPSSISTECLRSY